MIRSVAAARVIAALVLVTLGAAACSSPSNTAPTEAPKVPSAPGAASAAAGSTVAGSLAAASPGDPCVLITAADAAAALGGAVDPATSSFTGIYQSCSYATADGQNLIITTRTIDRAGFEAAVAQLPKPGPDPSPLAGVCQDAYTVGSNVWAWKNGTEVDARVLGTVDLLPAAKQLITLACSRL